MLEASGPSEPGQAPKIMLHDASNHIAAFSIMIGSWYWPSDGLQDRFLTTHQSFNHAASPFTSWSISQPSDWALGAFLVMWWCELLLNPQPSVKVTTVGWLLRSLQYRWSHPKHSLSSFNWQLPSTIGSHLPPPTLLAPLLFPTNSFHRHHHHPSPAQTIASHQCQTMSRRAAHHHLCSPSLLPCTTTFSTSLSSTATIVGTVKDLTATTTAIFLLLKHYPMAMELLLRHH